ncbi:hypothetical protein MFMK1_001708 [Metallumcola ferriviriculae]|uniref:Uncharacterized protein n=1 Tax=Metallumcola ferriviriculae TaxID=3039180 RepID=A0AAU0UNE9_9FIRM|nr:hypothetical protein MFMK1_001708 [Desulfitibacteraceae bacterium MK1]
MAAAKSRCAKTDIPIGPAGMVGKSKTYPTEDGWVRFEKWFFESLHYF